MVVEVVVVSNDKILRWLIIIPPPDFYHAPFLSDKKKKEKVEETNEDENFQRGEIYEYTRLLARVHATIADLNPGIGMCLFEKQPVFSSLLNKKGALPERSSGHYLASHPT